MTSLQRSLLFVSIGTNLFLIGLVVGFILLHPYPMGPVMRFMGIPPEITIEGLPKEKQAIVRKEFQHSFDKQRAIFDRIRKKSDQMMQNLIKDPHNKAPYEHDMKELQILHGQAYTVMQDTIRHIMTQLSPDERQLFFEHMQRMRPHTPPMGGPSMGRMGFRPPIPPPSDGTPALMR